MPRIPNEAEVASYFKTLSNWGRWGEHDQRGTLNLITLKTRHDAVRLVSEGFTISCSRPISREHGIDILHPFQHFMLYSGEAFAGKSSEGGDVQGSADYYGMVYHGFQFTHLDASSHIFWGGSLYNGRSAAQVTVSEGAAVGSVELVADGVLTRGVLLDIPKTRGVDWLELGDFVFPEDLEEAERAAGLRVREGDALLVRTGRWQRRARLGPWPMAEARVGLHAACLPWLRERGVALLGSDATSDSVPSGYKVVKEPIHQIGIPMLGLWLLDNADLDGLTLACQQRSRWEFLFVLAPLCVVGGTGSPVNPLAVF